MEKRPSPTAVFAPKQVDEHFVFDFLLVFVIIGLGVGTIAILFGILNKNTHLEFLGMIFSIGAALASVTRTVVSLIRYNMYRVKQDEWVWELTENNFTRRATVGHFYGKNEDGLPWSDYLFVLEPRMERTITAGKGESVGKITILFAMDETPIIAPIPYPMTAFPTDRDAKTFATWCKDLDRARESFVGTILFLEETKQRTNLPFGIQFVVRN